MKTLELILEYEKDRRAESGEFGITACKDSIRFKKDHLGVGYYKQLEEYVQRANDDICFNKAMVLACWELINEIQ